MNDMGGNRDAANIPTEFAAYENYHEGESILVCGCGRSLGLIAEPERFITIGVNDVGRMFQPDYIVVLNTPPQFAGDRFDYVKSSRAKTFFTHLNLPISHPNIVRFRLGRRGGTAPTNNSLPHTRNSPYLAANLAKFMGARRIGLIGVDFTYNHFWGQTGRHPLDREVTQIEREYSALARAFAEHGTEIVNLSPFSRIGTLPTMSLGEFASGSKSSRSLHIVSYSKTPVVGVPRILSDCINERTINRSKAVQGQKRYASGLAFEPDALWSKDTISQLREADLAIVHNGWSNNAHMAALENMPVLTMAHNMMWNVDRQHVKAGHPGVVVAQFPAAEDPAFQDWTPVPNPVPLWRPEFKPGHKSERITIVYTPADRREVLSPSDRMFMHSKGYGATVAVLDSLASRFDIDLVVRRRSPLSHADVMAAKQRAHIVIDECATGGYHRNSLEALATGCVVVNGVGNRTSVLEALRQVSAEDAPNPFETASMETLDKTLVNLIERGPDELAAMGRKGRAWMETYWDFEDQWRRFWVPAIDRTLEQAGRPRETSVVLRRTDHLQKPEAQQRTASRQGGPPTGTASVVIAYGEPGSSPEPPDQRRERLNATLSALKSCRHVMSVIVAEGLEPGAAAGAEELCRTQGVKHLHIDVDPGPFHKTRLLNKGAQGLESSHVLFLDADLIVPELFVYSALQEAEARNLDVLLPWRWLNFLSSEDSQAVIKGDCQPAQCKPRQQFSARSTNRAGAALVKTEFIRRHGGMIEEFRGWGGEDNAFFAKSEILGRVGVTRSMDMTMYHLHHPNSAIDRTAAAAANPQHTQNIDLLKRIRSCRRPHQLAELLSAFSGSSS